MSPFIVCTTIQAPTKALIDWKRHGELVVVGDRKTPADWALEGATFIGVDAQTDALARALPLNHYCRKNLGYVEAMKRGAEVIVDTDDDNLPMADWSVPAWGGVQAVADGKPWANIYAMFGHSALWPRGFPLNRIHEDTPSLKPRDLNVGVWQALANGDPDVDAIYRLTTRERSIRFEEWAPVVLGQGTLCPFNSQNTAFRKEVFPLLYLPAVTFRYTDILRGLVAQPLMWLYGWHLGFTTATVTQERNPHDYFSDFKSELPCYLHADDVPHIVQAAINPHESLSQNMLAAYSKLAEAGIVETAEVTRLALWLKIFE